MVIAIVDLTTVRRGYISWSVIAGRCLPNTKQPEHQQLPGKVIELQKGTRGASLPDASHGSEGNTERRSSLAGSCKQAGNAGRRASLHTGNTEWRSSLAGSCKHAGSAGWRASLSAGNTNWRYLLPGSFKQELQSGGVVIPAGNTEWRSLLLKPSRRDRSTCASRPLLHCFGPEG